MRYWWGVSADTVWKWRKKLGVKRVTEGSVRIRRQQAAEQFTSEVGRTVGAVRTKRSLLGIPSLGKSCNKPN